MSYHHFTPDERIRIEIFRKLGYSGRRISKELGFTPQSRYQTEVLTLCLKPFHNYIAYCHKTPSKRQQRTEGKSLLVTLMHILLGKEGLMKTPMDCSENFIKEDQS